MADHDARRLLPRMFAAQLLAFVSAALPFSYVLTVLEAPLSLAAGRALLLRGLLAAALFGVALPYLILRRGLRWALALRSSERPGARLTRLLELPARLGAGLIASYLLGVALCVSGGRGASGGQLALALACFGLLALLTAVPQHVALERLLQPLALEVFRQSPDALPRGRAPFWPRLTWYLPYTLAVFVLATLVNAGTVAGETMVQGLDVRLANLPLDGVSAAEVLAEARHVASAVEHALARPLLLLCAYLIAIALHAAYAVARYLRDGARAVRVALTSLASGKPVLAAWISTDELGELSRELAGALEQLKAFSVSMLDSAQTLGESAEELSRSNSRQSEELTLQATALQQTQITAQEIKQTSMLAARKADGVLAQFDRADEISRAGEAAIVQSLEGLQEIQQQVSEMATRIRALDERARQIAHITTTVKDLADQSNMLALNAAIEAVRSGEHGQGFGVVAREIRSLADQSIQATNHVRDILQDISQAIRGTVRITQRGAERVESSLAQVRAFGDHMRQLSTIVRENALAVRQISAAVNQQNAGIGQIFQAVNDLKTMMDDTLQRLRATDDATARVRAVAERVSGFVGTYGWQQLERPAPRDGDASTERERPPSHTLTPSPAT